MGRITELLTAGRTFSFEFFPPKNEDEQRLLTRTIADLQPLHPSFVSVTYRGGRISRERTTRVVVDLIKNTDLTPMAHLTCVAHPRFELGEILGGFRALGVENEVGHLNPGACSDAVIWECESLDELPYWMPSVRPDTILIRGVDLALPAVERRVWP